MSFRFSVYLPAVLAVIVLALATAGEASAHEERTVGEYELEVGFNQEPALVNQLNGVFLSVMKDDVPVKDLDESLKVEVIVGGGAAKKELSFEAVEDEPGTYVATFLPTVTGDYTFRIFGEIEGMAIDESFTSGPGRFDSVEPLDELAFPEPPADVSTLSSSIQELQAKVDSLEGGGSSSDSTARALGIAGLAAGLAALAVAGVTAFRRAG